MITLVSSQKSLPPNISAGSVSIANALSKAPLSKDSIEEWFSKSINIQAKFKQCNIGGFQLEFVSKAGL